MIKIVIAIPEIMEEDALERGVNAGKLRELE